MGRAEEPPWSHICGAELNTRAVCGDCIGVYDLKRAADDEANRSRPGHPSGGTFRQRVGTGRDREIGTTESDHWSIAGRENGLCSARTR